MTEHIGATEQWSPAAELAAAGQSPELSPPTEPEAAVQLAAELDAIEAGIRRALHAVHQRALSRLEGLR